MIFHSESQNKTTEEIIDSFSQRVLILVAGTMLSTLHSSGAATFDIADGDVAALKNAIITANTNSEADTINLAVGGHYVLTAIDNFTHGPSGLALNSCRFVRPSPSASSAASAGLLGLKP
jgi:hypothetical protein